MGDRRFVVHTSNRLEVLLTGLAEQLAAAPLPPLQNETIVVPGQGMARWLQLRLAERHGISASLVLPFPGAFLQALVGDDDGGDDLFDVDVLALRIFRLLGETKLQKDLAAAARYCRGDPDGKKRWQLSQRLARRFDDYQLVRDQLLLDFEAGKPVPLPHADWQAALWRALLADAGSSAAAALPAKGPRQRDLLPGLLPAAPAARPAHRLSRLHALLADPAAAHRRLPPRLCVFGITTLPAAFVDLLLQIAEHVPVTLYVPTPTAEYFGDQQRPRAGTAAPPGNRLLQSLGKQAREFADLLVDQQDRGAVAEPLLFVDPGEANLLATLQRDILLVQGRGEPGGPSRHALAAGDASLRVHSCHSPMREMEVMRDQLLAAFADDPELQPHEVMVLVPDIDTYAPFAHAVFRPLGNLLPYRVADRSPASDLPLCATFLRLLDLARDRLAVFDVLHLLDEPSLGSTFGIAPADLPALRSVCSAAAIRWGIDGAHRASSFQLPDYADNSWQQGIERLLLGIATGPLDELVAGRLPAADVTDNRSELLFRFVAFVQALFLRLRPLARPHPPAEWQRLLGELAPAMFSPRDLDDIAAMDLLRQAIADLGQRAELARVREPLDPSVLHEQLTDLLQQRADGRGFLSGAVTVAALQPMRTLPVKVLGIAGLDDLGFPRRNRPLPFDLVAADPRPGDRSPRDDDRQLFLDALLAARRQLILCYVGRSQKDDSVCAPAVVLDELLDWIDTACTPAPGHSCARAQVLVQQPLQAFSRRYRDGSDARLFTFEAETPAAAVAAPTGFGAIAVTPPADLDGEFIPLARLLDFWHHPSRFFLKQVLGVNLPRESDRDDDAEPFTLHNLDKYTLQDQALQRALRGQPLRADAAAHARASGLLPPGALGDLLFTDMQHETERLCTRLPPTPPLPRQVTVRGDSFLLHGQVDGITADALVLARAAKVKDKDRLRGFLLHVVLAVARLQGADLPRVTRVIGKDEVTTFRPIDGLGIESDPVAMLAMFVDGMRQGLRTPLPVFEHASPAFARKGSVAAEQLTAARRAWNNTEESAKPFTYDLGDVHVQLCWRDRDPVAEPAFATWAKAVWGLLLPFATDKEDA